MDIKAQSPAPRQVKTGPGANSGHTSGSKLRLYWKLFRTIFIISTVAFGGGFVIVSILKRKFVDDNDWIESKEMMDLISIAQSAPGAITVNASVLACYRVAGPIGVVIAVLGTTIPPLILIGLLAGVYRVYKDNPFVQALMAGIQVGVAAVILDVAWNMLREVRQDGGLPYILLAVGAFIVKAATDINIIWILVACGVIGFLMDRFAGRRGDAGSGQ